jgi:hypothetical protein
MKSHLPAGGDPRESPSPACSAVASPTAALATRRDISVRSRFPQGGRTSSRCRDPLWDATVFCRDSFDREDPVRHESALSLALQRPLTSCALRLRKPRLTSRSLTPSVVRRCSRGGSTTAAFASRALLSERSGIPPHQTFEPTTLFKGGEPRRPGRLPSARLLDLAIENGNHAFTLTFARGSLGTRVARRGQDPLSRGTAVTRYPFPARRASRPFLASTGRCSSPTSATD